MQPNNSFVMIIVETIERNPQKRRQFSRKQLLNQQALTSTILFPCFWYKRLPFSLGILSFAAQFQPSRILKHAFIYFFIIVRIIMHILFQFYKQILITRKNFPFFTIIVLDYKYFSKICDRRNETQFFNFNRIFSFFVSFYYFIYKRCFFLLK